MGALWAPYGNYYSVMLELDYNNRTENPTWDSSGGDAQVLHESILIWSDGKDGDEMTAKDNIKTW